MREARSLIVTLDKKTDRNKLLDIFFEYEGNLTEWPENSANVVTEDWVDLDRITLDLCQRYVDEIMLLTETEIEAILCSLLK